ncbi:MAG: pantetheine-phosphate adenylyltransferase [Clostridiales bacterium]|nr:pantetheine-phosphate adenylyltransferase [Clostridiales bacterium]
MSAEKCLFPGSFDPVTNGHMDIIRRAARIFDTVYVGILYNPDKQGCFPAEKRVEMMKKACEGIENVKVIAHTGLLAELTKKMDIPVVVKGVRGVRDLESETDMAHINHHLNPDMDTFFLPASPGLGEVSSSMVRQLAQFGADISDYVPKQVLPDVLAAFVNNK